VTSCMTRHDLSERASEDERIERNNNTLLLHREGCRYTQRGRQRETERDRSNKQAHAHPFKHITRNKKRAHEKEKKLRA